jgi:hypothetical protein
VRVQGSTASGCNNAAFARGAMIAESARPPRIRRRGKAGDAGDVCAGLAEVPDVAAELIRKRGIRGMLDAPGVEDNRLGRPV